MKYRIVKERERFHPEKFIDNHWIRVFAHVGYLDLEVAKEALYEKVTRKVAWEAEID